MSALDRELQRRILERLRQSYPAPVYARDISPLEPDASKLVFNLAYLGEHELLETKIDFSSDGNNTPRWTRAALTAQGVDFLEDDGGLSAILGVVTVKLHAETLRDLLAARVQADASLPEEKKSGLLADVKKLPETALQEVTKRLVQEGLARWPEALQLVQTLAHSVSS